MGALTELADIAGAADIAGGGADILIDIIGGAADNDADIIFPLALILLPLVLDPCMTSVSHMLTSCNSR